MAALTIRRTLLLAFLAVGLLPSLLLALLAFDRASRSLQTEIERGLTAQAEVLRAELGEMMAERLQNADTWRRIELMQDLQVADVDKRLAGFLQRLHAGYGGLYRELAAVDPQGRVVASSLPARLGQPQPLREGGQEIRLGALRVTMEPPQAAGDDFTLGLRTPVPSAFGPQALGELVMVLDGRRVDARLERAAVGGRLVALLDGQHRLLAGSQALRKRLPRLADTLAPWAADEPPPAGPLDLGPVLAGTARSGPGPQGLDWTVLVLVPRDEALAPVRTMGAIFAVLLAAVSAGTLAVALGTSQAIARPIAALTAFSRSRRPGAGGSGAPGAPAPGAAVPPALQARGEVGELARAYVAMLQDIEHSQQQLARATALAAVGEMSAVIAHEVRTPLGVMLSSAQILQRERDLSPEGRELLGYLESETARLARLVSTMLEGARPRAPQPVPTDLNALIQHAVGLLSAQAARQSVQVQATTGPAPLLLDCDGEQMTQVLLNLILNGLQVLPPGGHIQVSLHERAATGQEDAHVLIDIDDDGPGLDPQAQARVFEAFFFQREGGIGLGLAIVQRIVTAHGGRIEAGRSPLGGARFRIRLPGRAAPGQEPAA